MISPSNRRVSAYVRVVVLGVLRRAVFWAGKNRLFCRRPRPSGIWQAPYDAGQRCTLPTRTVCMRDVKEIFTTV